MRAITAFIKRHAVLTYYALVFAISWGDVLIVVGPTGFPGTSAQVERLMPWVILAFLVGPALGGPVLTGLAYGLKSSGLRRSRVSWLLQGACAGAGSCDPAGCRSPPRRLQSHIWRKKPEPGS